MFYKVISTSLIEPRYTNCFFKLGEHIFIYCAVTSKYVSLISSQRVFQLFLKIQAAMGQVSFTLDIWTGSNCRHYLAITAHWIAAVKGSSALKLKAALIAFHQLRKNHSGKELAETVMCLLDRAGVTVKVRWLSSRN
jgi:hypothetical protein